jgi:Tfp pilus assembly protein PilV
VHSNVLRCAPSRLRFAGFTLIEVLITAGVVTCGLVAVASMFSFAVKANIADRQMAVATTLLYDKMEEFKSTPFDQPLWKNGDAFDVISRDATYKRVWQVSIVPPRTVTVMVYVESALTHRQTELIRATTIISDTF